MLRGLIFDHDGTLVDSEKQHLRAWNRLLNDFGHHLPEEDYLRFHTGIPTIHSATLLVERFQLTLSPEQLAHAKQKQVLAEDEIPPLMAGARDLLLSLSESGIPMAVASGARFPEVERNLRNHGLYDLFRAVCTSSHVSNNKPAPDVYLLAAEKLGLKPDECLAVEDTVTGLRSATAAGMPCVVIPGPGAEAHDFSGASHLLPGLDHLFDWLKPHLAPEPLAAQSASS